MSTVGLPTGQTLLGNCPLHYRLDLLLNRFVFLAGRYYIHDVSDIESFAIWRSVLVRDRLPEDRKRPVDYGHADRCCTTALSHRR